MVTVNRNVLLRELGVQSWYAHYRLAARKSPRFDCAPLAERCHAARNEKAVVNTAFTAKAILAAVDAPAHPETNLGSQFVRATPILADGEADSADIEPKGFARVPTFSMQSFELACYTAGALLLFSVESQYEQARQQALLQNILNVCALTDEPVTYNGQLCWPVFRGDKIGVDQNSLLPELLLMWQKRSDALRRRACITFGAPPKLHALLVDASPPDAVIVSLSYSLTSLLREPAGKAQVWRELKDTLPSLMVLKDSLRA